MPIAVIPTHHPEHTMPNNETPAVPKPVTEPLEHKQTYFIANPVEPDLFGETRWLGKGDVNDRLWLQRGLIHLTRGAAIAHAKVMLGMDPHAPDADA